MSCKRSRYLDIRSFVFTGGNAYTRHRDVLRIWTTGMKCQVQYVRNHDDKDENWFVVRVGLVSNPMNPVGGHYKYVNQVSDPSWLKFRDPAWVEV